MTVTTVILGIKIFIEINLETKKKERERERSHYIRTQYLSIWYCTTRYKDIIIRLDYVNFKLVKVLNMSFYFFFYSFFRCKEKTILITYDLLLSCSGIIHFKTQHWSIKEKQKNNIQTTPSNFILMLFKTRRRYSSFRGLSENSKKK